MCFTFYMYGVAGKEILTDINPTNRQTRHAQRCISPLSWWSWLSILRLSQLTYVMRQTCGRPRWTHAPAHVGYTCNCDKNRTRKWHGWTRAPSFVCAEGDAGGQHRNLKFYCPFVTPSLYYLQAILYFCILMTTINESKWPTKVCNFT